MTADISLESLGQKPVPSWLIKTADRKNVILSAIMAFEKDNDQVIPNANQLARAIDEALS